MRENIPDNRRKYMRIASKHVLRCQRLPLSKGDLTAQLTSVTKNISLGGILFESPVAYDVGDLLKIDLHLPGWAQYMPDVHVSDAGSGVDIYIAAAVVIRVELVADRLYDVGVCFSEMDRRERWALMKYLYEKELP